MTPQEPSQSSSWFASQQKNYASGSQEGHAVKYRLSRTERTWYTIVLLTVTFASIVMGLLSSTLHEFISLRP
jgi:hypothetical protein